MNRFKRQQGVAVITALLLTTLAISIVASLFWQQQVQVRSMENQRLQLQTQWILRGALDWASVVLRQDGYDHGQFTALDHVWATPLAETRLDQYVERERVVGENFNATLSGNIIDACSRYNLTNLAKDGVVDPAQLKVFQRLLQNLRIDQGLAERTARLVAAGQPPAPKEEPAQGEGGGQGGTEGGGQGGTPTGTQGGTQGGQGGGQTGTQGGSTPGQVKVVSSSALRLLQVDDLLAVQGFNEATVERLRPFVVVLPTQTKVNVNTAPVEVLAAVLPHASVSEANALVVRRKQAAWRSLAFFKSDANSDDLDENIADVKSAWFLVNSRIRLDRATLNTQALVYRPLDNLSIAFNGTSIKWVHQN